MGLQINDKIVEVLLWNAVSFREQNNQDPWPPHSPSHPKSNITWGNGEGKARFFSWRRQCLKNVKNRPLSPGGHFVSGDLKSFVYARLASFSLAPLRQKVYALKVNARQLEYFRADQIY